MLGGRAAGHRGGYTARGSVRLVLVERQRARVDAVALAGRARPVGEHVPEVPATGGTGDLDAVHSVAVVGVELHVGAVRRLGEARPAGAGIELRVRGEQLGAAPGTAIGAVTLLVHVLAR